MKIRRDQFDAGLLANEEKFIDFMVEHLRQDQGEAEFIDNNPMEDVRDMIRNGMNKAKGYGFYTAGDLAAFISLMFEAVPNFDEHPELHAILTDDKIPVDERIDRLFDDSLEKAWEEVEQQHYDETDWFPELREDD